MESPYMPNRISHATWVGARASFSRTLTEADVALFIAQERQFKFLAPVYIGETATAEAVVVEADTDRNWVKLDSRCINSKGKEALRAEIQGYPGKFQDG